MRLKLINLFFFVLSIVLIFGSGCNIPMTAFQDLHVRFVNSAGEVLVEKNKLKIDTFVTNITTYSINESEYSLTLKINDVEFVPDFPLDYDGLNFRGKKFILFGCDANNSNLRNKRSSQTYSYDFVCPKLFGDDRPRKLDVVWATRKKTIYNIIEEVRFEGKVISNGSSKDPMFDIVIE